MWLRWEKKRTNTFVTKGDDDPDTTGQHRIIDRDFIQTAKNYDESKGTDYENYKFRSFSMDLDKVEGAKCSLRLRRRR